jgi:hypothetical protein
MITDRTIRAKPHPARADGGSAPHPTPPARPAHRSPDLLTTRFQGADYALRDALGARCSDCSGLSTEGAT